VKDLAYTSVTVFYEGPRYQVQEVDRDVVRGGYVAGRRMTIDRAQESAHRGCVDALAPAPSSYTSKTLRDDSGPT